MNVLPLQFASMQKKNKKHKKSTKTKHGKKRSKRKSKKKEKKVRFEETESEESELVKRSRHRRDTDSESDDSYPRGRLETESTDSRIRVKRGKASKPYDEEGTDDNITLESLSMDDERSEYSGSDISLKSVTSSDDILTMNR
jgi:hypothetical protein